MEENKTKTENVENNENNVKSTGKVSIIIQCVICFTALAVFLALIAIASYCNMSETLRNTLIFIGFINLLIYCFVAVYIEVKTGRHVCEKCGHEHKPTYLKTILAPHIGWTRYMKCPKCGEKSWQKKKFKN